MGVSLNSRLESNKEEEKTPLSEAGQLEKRSAPYGGPRGVGVSYERGTPVKV